MVKRIAFSENEKSTFSNMIERTKHCLNNTKPADHAGEIACETAYFSEQTNYTYHTHPRGVPYPSQADINTTARFKKKYLIIGLVPTREVIVWGTYPSYNRMMARFRL